MFRFLIALIVLCISLQASAQRGSYHRADSIALRYSDTTFKTPGELALYLTRNLESEDEKFRAIVRWVTENVEYSFSQRSTDPLRVMKKLKAVCGGYAGLVQALCSHAGIRCKVITGYAKNKYTHIGNKGLAQDHAWNAVKIDGDWKLVDPTWMAGSYNEQTRKFIKGFNEMYYYTDPEIFAETHLPADKEWQLLDHKRSKGHFINSPIKTHAFFFSGVTIETHKHGKLKVKEGDIIQFVFTSSQAVVNARIKYDYPKEERSGSIGGAVIPQDKGRFEVNFGSSGLQTGGFDLWVNDKLIARYWIEVIPDPELHK